MIIRNRIIHGLISLFVVLLLMYGCRNSHQASKQEVNGISYEWRFIPSTDKQDTSMLCYQLTLSERGNATKIKAYYQPSAYNRFLYYMNSALIKDIKAITDSVQQEPAMIHFEPNMKIVNRFSFLVAFEKKAIGCETVFEFTDNLFNNGIIKFRL